MRKDESLWQWYVASCFGFLVCGRFVPLCAVMHIRLPDGRRRRVYVWAIRWVWVEETDHLRKTCLRHAVGAHLREYDPPPIEGRTGSKPGY